MTMIPSVNEHPIRYVGVRVGGGYGVGVLRVVATNIGTRCCIDCQEFASAI